MTIEEISQTIHSLSDKDKIRLMQAVGPELCRAMMAAPEEETKTMMETCMKQMKDDPSFGRMCEMMQDMGMTGGGSGSKGGCCS